MMSEDSEVTIYVSVGGEEERFATLKGESLGSLKVHYIEEDVRKIAEVVLAKALPLITSRLGIDKKLENIIREVVVESFFEPGAVLVGASGTDPVSYVVRVLFNVEGVLLRRTSLMSST